MNLNGVDLGTDALQWTHLATRLALDGVISALVIQAIYWRRYRNREFVFTYYVFNLITFCLCFLLQRAPSNIGVGLSLFAVFGILRYRTEQIRLRDLTYLFIVIGIGLLNGVAHRGIGLPMLLTVNAAIVLMTAWLERRGPGGGERSTAMLYDRLEMLHPGREAELYADVGNRTGMQVLRIEVNQVDLLRDAAEITVHHRAPS